MNSHDGNDPCWEWKGCLRPDGYGAARNELAHRLVYRAVVGPIPDDMVLDHLCRNRLCVNPNHLEPVSNGENVLRGEGISARNALKTHCPEGHPYSESNTYRRVKQDGRVVRCCIACRGERRKRLDRVRTRSAPDATHCLRGHPFDAENTKWASDRKGVLRRYCWACRKLAYQAKTDGRVRQRMSSGATHCLKGHEMTENNTRKWFDRKTGRTLRGCRTCRAESRKK